MWDRSSGGCALVLVASLVGCASTRATAGDPQVRREPPIWVLAPHPDDESLMAAHVIAEGAPRTFVHLMTNGDLGCERDGWQRQREALAAARVLGLGPDRVRFLSYPDGALDALGVVPLPARERRLEDGRCALGTTTYAHDVHTALTGRAADYTADAAVSDLAALLARDRPRDVYVSHPFDDHPDHATTYVLLRRALERAMLDAAPRLHRALVHAGGCWPNGSETHEPCGPAGASLGAPYPPLPGALARYTPSERVPVPDGGARARRAIAEHRSQLHADVDHDWLGDFGRGESIYWLETLARDPLHPERLVRVPAPGVPAGTVGVLGPARVDDGARTHDVVHRAPLRASFKARVPESGEATLDLLGGYTIRIEGDHALEVRRGAHVVRRVRIPDDGARHAVHQWALRVDPRPDEGGVAELELRRDGALLAVLVDPEPTLAGAEIVIHARGGASLDAVALHAEAR